MCRILTTAVLLLALVLVGCGDRTQQPSAASETVAEVISGCIELPSVLPEGSTTENIKKSLTARDDVPLQMLVPEVLEELGRRFSPEEYFIDSSGLHWGHAKREISQTALGSCYYSYGFSIVGTFHFVYWLSYRPPSYDAYMFLNKIYAQPYGSNGILVQKRDICSNCACNPFCAIFGARVCAK